MIQIETDSEAEDDYNKNIDGCDEDNTTCSCSASVDDEDIETSKIALKINPFFKYYAPRFTGLK